MTRTASPIQGVSAAAGEMLPLPVKPEIASDEDELDEFSLPPPPEEGEGEGGGDIPDPMDGSIFDDDFSDDTLPDLE